MILKCAVRIAHRTNVAAPFFEHTGGRLGGF